MSGSPGLSIPGTKGRRTLIRTLISNHDSVKRQLDPGYHISYPECRCARMIRWVSEIRGARRQPTLAREYRDSSRANASHDALKGCAPPTSRSSFKLGRLRAITMVSFLRVMGVEGQIFSVESCLSIPRSWTIAQTTQAVLRYASLKNAHSSGAKPDMGRRFLVYVVFSCLFPPSFPHTTTFGALFFPSPLASTVEYNCVKSYPDVFTSTQRHSHHLDPSTTIYLLPGTRIPR